ncbi:hypothetical protein LSH36_2691g00003 [Paralvinella palmiformis]|uniref:Uncharacterized protein n=1 Tax=Paralvinella palmiformis TaxID=53620 RepID=A0AAD9MK92_9ANNE|nr:hypothetical protein LSH36_2691g00003 [Paralvinella palmiformis]
MAFYDKIFLVALCLLVLSIYDTQGWLFSSSSSRGSSRSNFPHDVRSRSGLTSLYNRRVTHVDHYERPLGNSDTMVGPFRHSGVVVRTDDGGRFLVHKGDGYGRSSQTVVTDAKHMSDRWRRVGGHDVSESRVGDFVEAGGSEYSLTRDNCHDGRCRMMDLP